MNIFQVGDVSILINNAGIVTGKKILECPDELMQKTMDVCDSRHNTHLMIPVLRFSHVIVLFLTSSAGQRNGAFLDHQGLPAKFMCILVNTVDLSAPTYCPVLICGSFRNVVAFRDA